MENRDCLRPEGTCIYNKNFENYVSAIVVMIHFGLSCFKQSVFRLTRCSIQETNKQTLKVNSNLIIRDTVSCRFITSEIWNPTLTNVRLVRRWVSGCANCRLGRWITCGFCAGNNRKWGSNKCRLLGEDQFHGNSDNENRINLCILQSPPTRFL